MAWCACPLVELPVDLACLDLSQCDLLFNVIEDHQEVFALLRVSGVAVGRGNNCAVVLHKFESDLQFLAECDEEVEFFDEGEDGESFHVC